LNRNAPSGTGWVWPASGADGGWEQTYGTEGNLYMGSLLAIPPDADLSFITDPRIMNLAIALRDYGGIITDRGSDIDWAGFPGCIGYLGERSNPEVDAISSQYEQLGRMTALLRVVSNNASDRRGGGGRPRTCFAPPLE
jgi:hypothetical protein